MSLNSKKINASLATTLGLASTLTLAGLTSAVSATGVSGNVQLNTEVSTSIAMKIASPNDTNPDCMVQSGITYGVANRYATSNGAEGSKQVDGFDGTPGGADELNTNTSCATLTMTPNTFDSTYSDVTVYTNSGNGYAVSLRSADNTSPNLVKTNSDGTLDSTQYIAAGALTESGNTVPGGQNKWAYKTDNGITTSWTAATTTDATIKSYDQETSGGDTTRVTYGISAGNNPTGKYATTLTYTATMFDGDNPYVPTIDITGAGGTGTVEGATLSGDALKGNKLTVPYKATRTLTISPDEGYYLTSFTCPDGFTCSTPTTGSADDPSADARVAQDISITNNSVNSGGSTITMPITLDNKYRISFSKTNISSPSEDYVDVAYGGQATVTVTPASGYYLSAFSGCPSGWTCSGVSTGTSYTGNQTLTLKNNSSVNTGTITLTGTLAADPMQGFSCSSLSSGITKTLRDSRDNNDYTVAKLADGKCWMTSNLRLQNYTLKSTDSNVSSNFTVPASSTANWCTTNSAACDNQAMTLDSGNASYGTYYNWYTATAGQGTYSKSSGDVSASVCPKGWRLPTSIEFNTMYNQYGSSANLRATGAGQPAFVLSGNRNGSSTNNQGSGGSYWSSTASDSNYAYYLYLDSSIVLPQDDYNKYLGFSVRCVASS